MAKRWKLLYVLAALLMAGPAFAHATLTGSTPADGAVLDSPPKMLEVSFDDPVILTRVEIAMTGMTMPVSFKRAADAAKTFSVPLPALPAGKYALTWGALSQEDGHAMTGTLSFTVKGD